MKLFKRTSKITSILKEPLQERDIFIKIRKLGRQFTLTFRLILIVGVVLLISLMIALGLDESFTLLLGELIDVPDIIEVGLIGILVAIFSTYFISRWLIDPLQKVGPAMDKISNGDYSVRLETIEIRERKSYETSCKLTGLMVRTIKRRCIIAKICKGVLVVCCIYRCMIVEVACRITISEVELDTLVEHVTEVSCRR